MLRRALLPLAAAMLPILAQTPAPRTSFRIKYVAEEAVYIDGGRAAGLAEKMKLTVRRGNADAVIAELEIVSVADASAVCEVRSSTAALAAGDTARLSSGDAQRSEMLRAAGGGTHYAQTITFTDGDPLDEEVREYMPHPPSPEVNRVRGRVGLEYTGISDQGGSGANSSQMGLVLRADMTRIGGSFWNLSGYTRLQLNSTSSSVQQQTLNDLLNRTYHLTLTYSNPRSSWTAGFGRFYLPWAASLSTIDGGYVARHMSRLVTVGMFAGTTPDPTSWNYNPNREMAGAFVNFEGGSYEGVRYSSTEGLALSRLSWKPEREFLFFENTFAFRRLFTLYDNLEVDQSHPTKEKPTANGTSVARSFLTLRFEPVKLISFDLSHNYFRDFPTFDPRLVGTGLVDRFLFQGLSGGVRVNLPRKMTLYASAGRNSGSSDPQASWNKMYGVSMADLLGTGIRADYHYSHFDSSFGRGSYQVFSLNREVWDALRLEVQLGQQNFTSAVTTQTRARYVNGNLDWTFARHYFAGGGVTVYRGQSQNYIQTFFSLGYRF
jgi:hypothetical protein